MRGAVGAVVVLTALPVSAAEFRHKVGSGQTLETIARHFYGSSWKAIYISSRNDIGNGATLKTGKSVVLPSSWLYTVKKGDSLVKVSQKYLGDSDRHKTLASQNRLKGSELAAGTELLMPFHLRYTVSKGDSLTQIAYRFYRSGRRAGLLRDYNKVDVLKPGQRLTIPIFDRATLDIRKKPPLLVKATAASAASDDSGSPATATAPSNRTTSDVNDLRLKTAVEGYAQGDFEDACAELEQLITEDELSPRDRLRIIQHLAYCAVAYEDLDAARDYMTKWLELEPGVQLDPEQISPKIIAVFKEVAAERDTSQDG